MLMRYHVRNLGSEYYDDPGFMDINCDMLKRAFSEEWHSFREKALDELFSRSRLRLISILRGAACK